MRLSEAARAGEAGRGFSVVATEISKLAQETSDSVASINDIVQQVNDSVSEIAEKTGNVVIETAENVDLVDNCVKSVEDLEEISNKFKI